MCKRPEKIDSVCQVLAREKTSKPKTASTVYHRRLPGQPASQGKPLRWRGPDKGFDRKKEVRLKETKKMCKLLGYLKQE